MYGIVDIGSNTMRLVIFKVENGKPRLLLNKKEMPELASFIKDGMMVAEGINEACYILDSFNLLAKDLGVENLMYLQRHLYVILQTVKQLLVKLKIEQGLL